MSKVILVTGKQGVGKTTLINKFIKEKTFSGFNSAANFERLETLLNNDDIFGKNYFYETNQTINPYEYEYIYRKPYSEKFGCDFLINHPNLVAWIEVFKNGKYVIHL